ncbi:MAG TPA: hypothetical protein VFG89_09530 [Coriobacteriia bacterium]|nr:hypothetical protein [Coriobacteriia bacterium]
MKRLTTFSLLGMLTLTIALAASVYAAHDADASQRVAAYPPKAVAVAAKMPSATRTPSTEAKVNPAEVERARSIVSQLAKTYRYLDGVTVEFGVTPEGREAVAYYTEGQILVSSTHKVELDKILAHEIWHVIDWRDNGRLDWGEDLPPDNSSDYLL